MTIYGKMITGAFLLLVGMGVWYFAFKPDSVETLSFTINGEPITLVGGVHEKASAPGSASKTVTTYFGNEVRADFNNDGVEDRVFIVTQTSGGSGVFYYLATNLGGDAAFLGDRIAPQTTEYRNSEIIVNYADRKTGEPMTTAPSVGVSKYFTIQNTRVVEKVIEEEGSSTTSTTTVTTTIHGSGMINGYVTLSPTCPVERNPPDPNCAPKAYVTEVSAINKLTGNVMAHTKTTTAGFYVLDLPTGDYTIRATSASVFPRCSDQDVVIQENKTVTLDISCDSGIR